MRFISQVVIIAVAVGLTLVASSCGRTQTQSLPPGVSEREWVPLSDSAGVVLAERTGTNFYHSPSDDSFAGMPRLSGTLMVRRNETWAVVGMASDLPTGLVPLH